MSKTLNAFSQNSKKRQVTQFFHAALQLAHNNIHITRSHGDASVVRTAVKVNGKWQNKQEAKLSLG